MNEKTSLMKVMSEYGDYNLLLPAATDEQISPFYRYHVEVVPVNTDPEGGEIFKVGSAKSASGRGYEDVFSLAKPLLNKMAMAAGIQFNAANTHGERINATTYRATAEGAMRKPDGTVRKETDQKEICLDDEEERFQMEAEEKAKKGLTDEKAAEDARKIFKGQDFPTTNRWGKQVTGFLIAPEDRDKYISRYVITNMALLRKTWAEKAMTGAKLRVIRALLGVKGTYKKEELKKGFAITTVVFSPDYTDPQVQKMMLQNGMNSALNMFQTNQLTVKRVDYDDSPVEVIEGDEDNAAFTPEPTSDDDVAIDVTETPPAPQPQPPVQNPQNPAPAPGTQPTQAPEAPHAIAEDLQCDKCGAVISEKVWDYSIQKFGRPLCYNCQRGARR